MRRLPALLALFAIAAFLSACGGGGGSSGSSGNSTASGAAATPPTSSSAAATAGATGTKPTGSSPGHSKSEAAKRAAYEKKRYGSPSPQSAPFSKYSGESSNKGQSGQPALHLAEFGKEAAEARRREAGGVIEEYLQAKGAGEWEKACAYLAADVKAQAEGLAKQQGTEGGCGPALAMIVKTFGGDNRAGPLQASQGIASLRVQEGGRAGEGAGFALFHGSDGADYWMAVKREGGTWKVLSPAPQPLR